MGKIVPEEGATPLMYACQQARERDVLDILTEKPRSIYEIDRTHKTALHYCSEAPTTACAELLLKHAPELLEAQDEDGFTALHLVVIAGNVGLLQLLISKGANVNALDHEKHSPIHWATVCGEREALETLIKAGASISTADIHGGFPLHYAAQMCGSGAETGVSSRTGLAILRTLLAHGANVEEKDKDGRQPILWAASADAQSRDPRARFTSSGSSEAILALVKAGASVDAADKDGLTALHCAASRGHTDCLETLVAFCGANVDVIDNNGCTALFYAVTLGHADATQLLLNLGAEPNRQDRKGRTPAHCGAAKGQLETIRLLLSSGANLWLRNVKGDIPLHEAVASGRKELVRWLLNQRSESVNVANNDGKYPIHAASINNNVDMIKILLDAGSLVNPVMRSSKGTLMTPLDAALMRSHRTSAKFLQLHGGVPYNKLNESAAALKGTLSREVMSQVAVERVMDSSDAFTVLPAASIAHRFFNDTQTAAEDMAIQHIERIKKSSDLESIPDEEERSRRRRRRRKSERRRSRSFENAEDESLEEEDQERLPRPRKKSNRKKTSEEETFNKSRRKSIVKNNDYHSDEHDNNQEIPEKVPSKELLSISGQVLSKESANSTLPKSSQQIKIDEDEKDCSNNNTNNTNNNTNTNNNANINSNNKNEQSVAEMHSKGEVEVNQSSSSFEDHTVVTIQTKALVHESAAVESDCIGKETNNKTPEVEVQVQSVQKDENEFLREENVEEKPLQVETEKTAESKDKTNYSVVNKNQLQPMEPQIVKRRQSQPGITNKDNLETSRKAISQPSSRRSSRERGAITRDWSNDRIENPPEKKENYNFWEDTKDQAFYPLHLADASVGMTRLGEADGRSASVGDESNASTRNEDSSLVMDSGIEPSPRRVFNKLGPKSQIDAKQTGNAAVKKNVRLCRKGKQAVPKEVTDSVTQAVQNTVRKYHLERKIFYQLLELKRMQIRAGRANEQVLVKRLADEYHRSGQLAGLKFYTGPYNFYDFEVFLYEQLHALQTVSNISKIKPSKDVETLSEFLKRPEFQHLDVANDLSQWSGPDPKYCTSSTHRCFHATHAYTGIPCAAYITKLNHHTMPKENFLPKIDTDKIGMKKISSGKGPVTLEVIHGKEKQIIELPTEKLDQHKRYYVSFTIKGGSTTPEEKSDFNKKTNF